MYVLQYSYQGTQTFITSVTPNLAVNDPVFGAPLGAGKYLRLIGYKLSSAKTNTAGAKFTVQLSFTSAANFFATHVFAGSGDIVGAGESGSGWVFFPEPGLFDASILNTNGLYLRHQCTLATQGFFFDLLYSIETTL